MSAEIDPPEAKDKSRRSRGFRPAAALITEQMATAAAKRGYALARLQALWAEIAGPEIAAVARPVRLATARGPAGGLMTLAVHGANAPQVQMLLPLIRERVNAALGPNTVGRIQLTQSGLPEVVPPPLPAPPPEPDMSRLAEGLSSIGDPELRAALETLARNVVSRARTPSR